MESPAQILVRELDAAVDLAVVSDDHEPAFFAGLVERIINALPAEVGIPFADPAKRNRPGFHREKLTALVSQRIEGATRYYAPWISDLALLNITEQATRIILDICCNTLPVAVVDPPSEPEPVAEPVVDPPSSAPAKTPKRTGGTHE